MTVFHAGDWIIESGDTRWRGNGTLVLSGNLTVQGGGALTLSNMTLLMNGTFNGQYGLTVNSGGLVTLINVSMAPYPPLSTVRYGVRVFGTLRAQDSILSRPGTIQVSGGTLDLNRSRCLDAVTCVSANISNVTVTESQVGPSAFAAIGANQSNITVLRSTFSDMPLGINLLSSESLVDGNTFRRVGEALHVEDGRAVIRSNDIRPSGAGRGIYMAYRSNDASIIQGNVISDLDQAAIHLVDTDPFVSDNVISNASYGIFPVVSNVTVWNSTIEASKLADVWLEDTWPRDSHPVLINVTHDDNAVLFQNWRPQNATVDVRWLLRVRTRLPNGDWISGASVQVSDRDGAAVYQGVTGTDGLTPPIVTRQFLGRDLNQSGRSETAERTYFTPHRITATWGPYSAAANVALNSSRTVVLLLGAMANMTVVREPLRGNVTVDRVATGVPAPFTWPVGSNHTVEAPLLDNPENGTRYVFLNWSDGGDPSHRVIVPDQNLTLTAYYRTQHRLRLDLPGTDADHPVLMARVENETALTITAWGRWEGWADAGTVASLSDCTSGEPRRCTEDVHRWTVTAPVDATVRYAADNWKPLVALLFAFTITLVGLLTARKYPRPYPRHPVAKTWTLYVLPFVILEGLTGLLSLLTGLLAIPPLLGLGTAVDLALLAAGLLLPYGVLRKRAGNATPAEPPRPGSVSGR